MYEGKAPDLLLHEHHPAFLNTAAMTSLLEVLGMNFRG